MSAAGGLPINDIPAGMLYEQIVYPACQELVGKTCTIVHLQSERGKTLNNKLCVVKGSDRDQGESRLHCSVQEENSSAKNTTIKLKFGNVRPVDGFNPVIETFFENAPLLTDAKILKCLEKAIKEHSDITEQGRPDMYYRLNLYKNLISKLQSQTTNKKETPNSLPDSDYCFPCGAGAERLDGNLAIVLTKTKPACWGTGQMDVRRANIGLVGDDCTECSICCQVLKSPSDGQQQQLDDRQVVLVTLPCLHVFHKECTIQWLGSQVGSRNWNCPTCRQVVPDNMSTFCNPYNNEQLQSRINEYPVSGFCTKCNVMIMENHRNDELPMIPG